MQRFREWVRGWVQRLFGNASAWVVYHEGKASRHIGKAKAWKKIHSRRNPPQYVKGRRK